MHTKQEASCSVKGPKIHVKLEASKRKDVCIGLLCETPQDAHKIGNLEEQKALALRKAQDSCKIRNLEEESRLILLALRKAPTCTHDKNLKEERR